MPTDPFVPEQLENEPRQLPNLAPGVKIPPARSWRADRPGDLPVGQPHGKLLGSPGPNVGYALKLVELRRDALVLAPHEHADDALAVIAEIAMKRAAEYGRAPVMHDVDVAIELLGYLGDADPEYVTWRVHAVEGAHHTYRERRALVDAIPIDVLRLAPSVIGEHVGEARQALQSGVPAPLQ